MRSLIVMAMFTSSLTYGAWNGYTETRDLELSTSGVDILEIDAGAGGIVVNGATDSSIITVKAIIRVDDNEDDAIEMIEKHLVLKLEKKHSKAVLDAYFEQSAWHYNDSAAVDLEISIPHGLAIFVDDGSGSIDVRDVELDLNIVDDGSGSVRIADVRGAVHRDD